MKTVLSLLFLCLWALLLTGCAGGLVPVTDVMVDKAGNVIEVTSGYTKDASIAKEQAVMNAHKNRDAMYAKMYATSGTKLKFKMVEPVPGVWIQVMEEVTIRDAPHFDQDLPMQPSVHPVWGTVNSVAATVAKYGLIGYGISELSNVWQAGLDAAGDTIYNQSFNQGESVNYGPGSAVVPVEGEDLPGDTEWFSPGCSVESHAAGRC